jgi:hypothetical protein
MYQQVYQPVPGPLPFMGISAGFAWSRQLRRKIKSNLEKV